MARRNKPERFEIPPDVRYGSVEVQSFINRVMRRGKKSLATRLVYDALEMIQEKTKEMRWRFLRQQSRMLLR